MKKIVTLISALAFTTGLALADHHEEKKAPAAEPKVASTKGAKVYIVSPKDGKTVKKKFTIRFGLKGMGIAPAGIKFPNTGHHHLIIDGAKFDMDLPLPMSDTLKHFGGGQTEATIELAPGKHTLQLVLGDHLHRPHNPPILSKVVTITVGE
jgi:hypothetical protein